MAAQGPGAPEREPDKALFVSPSENPEKECALAQPGGLKPSAPHTAEEKNSHVTPVCSNNHLFDFDLLDEQLATTDPTIKLQLKNQRGPNEFFDFDLLEEQMPARQAGNAWQLECTAPTSRQSVAEQLVQVDAKDGTKPGIHEAKECVHDRPFDASRLHGGAALDMENATKRRRDCSGGSQAPIAERDALPEPGQPTDYVEKECQLRDAFEASKAMNGWHTNGAPVGQQSLTKQLVPVVAKCDTMSGGDEEKDNTHNRPAAACLLIGCPATDLENTATPPENCETVAHGQAAEQNESPKLEQTKAEVEKENGVENGRGCGDVGATTPSLHDSAAKQNASLQAGQTTADVKKDHRIRLKPNSIAGHTAQSTLDRNNGSGLSMQLTGGGGVIADKLFWDGGGARRCVRAGCRKTVTSSYKFCSKECAVKGIREVIESYDPRTGFQMQVVAFYYPGREELWDTLCCSSFLGNFFEAPLVLLAPCNGQRHRFRNAEAAFQATKFWHRAREFENLTGQQAFTKKRSLGAPDFTYGGFGSNWNAMWAVLAAKFAPGTRMAEKLLGTGDAFLLEHNARCERDTIWSNNNDGEGSNWLGLHLMLHRDRLRAVDPGEHSLAPWTMYIRDHVDLDTGAPLSGGGLQWQDCVRRATYSLLASMGEELPPRARHCETGQPSVDLGKVHTQQCVSVVAKDNKQSSTDDVRDTMLNRPTDACQLQGCSAIDLETATPSKSCEAGKQAPTTEQPDTSQRPGRFRTRSTRCGSFLRRALLWVVASALCLPQAVRGIARLLAGGPRKALRAPREDLEAAG